jgi:hypothetical protein
MVISFKSTIFIVESSLFAAVFSTIVSSDITKVNLLSLSDIEHIQHYFTVETPAAAHSGVSKTQSTKDMPHAGEKSAYHCDHKTTSPPPV